MPRESSIVSRTRKHFAEIAKTGCHVIKTTGDGEPDLVGCVDGQTIVVECKQPGERPRPLQYVRLRQWAKAGAWALWCDGIAYYGFDLTDGTEFRFCDYDDGLRRLTLDLSSICDVCEERERVPGSDCCERCLDGIEREDSDA